MQAQMQAHAMAAAMAAFGQGQNPGAAATQAALGGDGISGGSTARRRATPRTPPTRSEGAGEKK